MAINTIRGTVSPRFLIPRTLLLELAGNMFVTYDGFHLVSVLGGHMRTARGCSIRGACPARNLSHPDRHRCHPPAIGPIAEYEMDGALGARQNNLLGVLRIQQQGHYPNVFRLSPRLGLYFLPYRENFDILQNDLRGGSGNRVAAEGDPPTPKRTGEYKPRHPYD